MNIQKTKNLFNRFLNKTGDAQFNILYKKRNNSIINPQLRLGLACYQDTAYNPQNIDNEILTACVLKLLFEYKTHLYHFKDLKVSPPFLTIDNILLNVLTHTKGYEYTDIARQQNIYNDPRYGYINISIKKNDYLKGFMNIILQTDDYNLRNIFENNFNDIVENINNNLTYTYKPYY
tara:strand:+ start:729 stop:1259 length:531 start_codon:yes stop_codon:yes gene_type:complete